MFKALFVYPKVRARHENAPWAARRDAYLTHLDSLGSPKTTLQRWACMLSVVVRLLIPAARAAQKVAVAQVHRVACVYIRQSTAYQVRFHLEGQKRQYGLSDRARGLGFTQVVVIDEDLGRSGSGLQERPGFGRLLAAVCQGAAGAVVALEASRLARNNRDWHHFARLL
jgi:Resolvase, N terminal domain